jgi:hypothetical protein
MADAEHVCEVCDMIFTRTQSLANHRRRHVNRGPPVTVRLIKRVPALVGGPPAQGSAPAGTGDPQGENPDPPPREDADGSMPLSGRMYSIHYDGGGGDGGWDHVSERSVSDNPSSPTRDDDDADPPCRGASSDFYTGGESGNGGGGGSSDSDGESGEDVGGSDDEDEQQPPNGPPALAARRAMQLNASHLAFLRLVHKGGFTEQQTNALLAFFHDHPAERLGAFPRRLRTLHFAAERAAEPNGEAAGRRFIERVYEVDGQSLHATVRDVWEVILHTFLLQPKVAKHLVFGPPPPLLPGQEPQMGEFWTGRWWQRAHAMAPRGLDIVALILHLDDTPVCGSGGRSMLPVYVTLGNLPLAQRRLHSNLPVVAYVPRPDAPAATKKTSAYRSARRQLLHKMLADLLAPLRRLQDQGGVVVAMGAGEPRHRTIYPLVALVVADNEEKAQLLLAYKKKNGAHPCHECLVTSADLGDTVSTATNPRPPRTIRAAKALVREAAAPGAAGAQGRARARALSMHPLVNGLWTVLWLRPGLYHACPPDLLHDADLGVYRRLVATLFEWLKDGTPAHRAAAVTLDERIHALTAAPTLAIKRFGAGGYSGTQRLEGQHFRSLMAILPLALVGLPRVDVATVAALAVEWVGLYGFLRQRTFTDGQVAQWRARAAAWGARMSTWVQEVGESDGAYIKHHQLLGGHMADAMLEYGAPANFDAAPFEGRHTTSVKAPARRTSRAVALGPQLAKRARRAEMIEQLATVNDRASEGDSSSGGSIDTSSDSEDSDDDDRDGGLGADAGWSLCVPAGPFDVVAAERHLRVQRLVRLTATAINEHGGDGALGRPPAGAQDGEAALAALAATLPPATLMRRVRLADGSYAHARPAWRDDGARHDDVAVRGQAGATWYAKLIAPVTFQLPLGRRLELVLVRWYENAPPYAARTAADATVRATVATVCPRLQLAPRRLDWLLPGQLLWRAALVRDVAAPDACFANNFLHQLRASETP